MSTKLRAKSSQNSKQWPVNRTADPFLAPVHATHSLAFFGNKGMVFTNYEDYQRQLPHQGLLHVYEGCEGEERREALSLGQRALALSHGCERVFGPEVQKDD
jgi:hypothetical protein